MVTMHDDETPVEGRRMLEEQDPPALGNDVPDAEGQEVPDLAIPEDEATDPEAERPLRPEQGDPPDAVRGPAQSLVDPVGDIADDGTLRWDPRTVRAPTREGG
jgi:hypothetical protein